MASTTLKTFSERVLQEWLPVYCDHPRRGYSRTGFRQDTINKVRETDAQDFMRAMDSDLVTCDESGRLTLPRSKATEVIFWEGQKMKTPRPIWLWLEPIITIAAAGRLYFDYGWPKESLGSQSQKWAFDLMAFRSVDCETEFIAGEVKKTRRELDALITNLRLCCEEGTEICSSTRPARINAHKKWLGLKRARAPLFWAVGPGRHSVPFDVAYSGDKPVRLTETSLEALRFKG